VFFANEFMQVRRCSSSWLWVSKPVRSSTCGFEIFLNFSSFLRTRSFTKGKPERIIANLIVKFNLKSKAKDDVCVFCDPGFVAYKVGVNGPMIVAFQSQKSVAADNAPTHKRMASNDQSSLSSSSSSSLRNSSTSVMSSSPVSSGPIHLESLEERLARRAASSSSSSSPPSPTRDDFTTTTTTTTVVNQSNITNIGNNSPNNIASSSSSPARSTSPPIAPLSASSVDAPTFVFADNVHRSPLPSRLLQPTTTPFINPYFATPATNANNNLFDHQLLTAQKA
jgi:hypothetical protein